MAVEWVGVPVLVAKIDNSSQARPPPVGLGAADVVDVEPVEGGLSRLAAVFSTDKPPVTLQPSLSRRGRSGQS
ncbi:DUF3048 domain-containing protein [Nocardia fusca]|uniref:DUF3048 domain-containing protein n=1 Tax=Nocardia fusca TaxID=941183 RepID=UPI000AF77A9F